MTGCFAHSVQRVIPEQLFSAHAEEVASSHSDRLEACPLDRDFMCKAATGERLARGDK